MDANQILNLLDEPVALEALYAESPRAFENALNEALDMQPDAIVLRVWAARLSSGQRTDHSGIALGPAIAIALGCGLLVRVPAIWLGSEWYLPRFAPSCVILALSFYFWLENRERSQLIAGLVLAALTIVLASLLPGYTEYTDSVVMALLHLPVLWWVFLGFVFTGTAWRQTEPRIRFLRYNGELLILGSLVALGAIVFSGLTVALFTLVGEEEAVAEWYVMNIGLVGAAAVPVAGTYLYDSVFGRHTGIASVLARIFAPLFLAMTGIYLLVALLGGQNPFVDRAFLITVNGLLLVVLGMTILSIAERGEDHTVGWIDYTSVALLAMTLLIDLVALSAILFRLASFGFTPNRVVVLGANIVILVHLALVLRAYIRFLGRGDNLLGVRRAAAGYLPVYAAWAALVSFVFPFVFRFS